MQPTFTISCGEFKRTRPLLDGRVRPEGFDLRAIPDPFPEHGILADYQHTRNQTMLINKTFDICEMGMAPYLSARASGAPLIAIPVFHYRRFRHGYLFCREGAGIHGPADLAGRRVGVRRLNLTAGVWARALLQHEYGVPLEKITWVVSIDVPLRQEVRERLTVQTATEGEPLESLLVRGDLDAMIEASVPQAMAWERSGLRRLLGEDIRQIEVDYYAKTMIFPIMHTVVLWKDILSKFPHVAENLLQAFRRAQDIGRLDPDKPMRYILAEEERRWWNSLTDVQRQTMQRDRAASQDPWIYSLREDRKTVETLLDYAHEQGLTPSRYEAKELFAASTLDL